MEEGNIETLLFFFEVRFDYVARYENISSYILSQQCGTNN